MATLFIGPIRCNPAVQTLGGTVYISFETRSTASVLADAGTSTKIQILGPDNAVVTAYTSATKDSTGKYSYGFATTAAMSPGGYSVQVQTVDGGVTSVEQSLKLFGVTGLA